MALGWQQGWGRWEGSWPQLEVPLREGRGFCGGVQSCHGDTCWALSFGHAGLAGVGWLTRAVVSLSLTPSSCPT